MEERKHGKSTYSNKKENKPQIMFTSTKSGKNQTLASTAHNLQKRTQLETSSNHKRVSISKRLPAKGEARMVQKP